MPGFLAASAIFIGIVLIPITGPFKVVDTQENSILIKAFDKNFEKANLHAKSFCEEKGKVNVLNEQESRAYMVITNLNEYKFDCINE